MAVYALSKGCRAASLPGLADSKSRMPRAISRLYLGRAAHVTTSEFAVSLTVSVVETVLDPGRGDKLYLACTAEHWSLLYHVHHGQTTINHSHPLVVIYNKRHVATTDAQTLLAVSCAA